MSAFTAILERFFQLEEHNSDIVTELRAGAVTFFTSSYIIFVQPAVLSSAWIDFGAVMTATCLASAIGCLIMGLWANYPIALAPGMAPGFISYPLTKLFCGKAREVHWCIYLGDILFVFRYSVSWSSLRELMLITNVIQCNFFTKRWHPSLNTEGKDFCG